MVIALLHESELVLSEDLIEVMVDKVFYHSTALSSCLFLIYISTIYQLDIEKSDLNNKEFVRRLCYICRRLWELIVRRAGKLI